MTDLPTLAIRKNDAPLSHGGKGGESTYTDHMSKEDRTASQAAPTPAALVGWSTMQMGERLVLHLQSVTKPPPHRKDDITSQYFVITQNQAVQLGNYLFEITGQTPPRKHKRGMLEKLLRG